MTTSSVPTIQAIRAIVTDADTDEEGTWFWNQSANELESDSECDECSDEEGDLAYGSASWKTRTTHQNTQEDRLKKIMWGISGMVWGFAVAAASY